VIKYFIFFEMLFIFASCKYEKNGKICNYIDSAFVCRTISNSHLIKLQTFKKAKTEILDGVSYNFSIKGDTLVKSYYSDGKLIGGYYEYYPNGRPKRYICFDSFNQDTMFYREYGLDNKITKEKGELLYGKGYTSYDESRLKDDGLLDFYSVLVAPPISSSAVKVYAIKVGFEKDTIRPVSNSFEVGQNNLLLVNKLHLMHFGSYHIYVTTELRDSLNRQVLRKSEIFKIDR